MPGRACILLMDSLGIGASLDAHRYGDEAANTFGHIHIACSKNRADKRDLRKGALYIPNLTKLGLYHAAIASSGVPLIDLSTVAKPEGYYGYAVEQSLGKDTPSGHWELAGVPVRFDWGYFPYEEPCFPQTLIDELLKKPDCQAFLVKSMPLEPLLLKSWGKSILKRANLLSILPRIAYFKLRLMKSILVCNVYMRFAKLPVSLLMHIKLGVLLRDLSLGSQGLLCVPEIAAIMPLHRLHQPYLMN